MGMYPKPISSLHAGTVLTQYGVSEQLFASCTHTCSTCLPCRFCLAGDIIVVITSFGMQEGLSFPSQEVEQVAIATVFRDH